MTTASRDDVDRNDDYLRRFSGVVESLDPIGATNNGSEAVITQLFDGLTRSPNAGIDAELQLATNCQVGDDGRSYTFDLKRGVQFHDDYGESTASDVV